MKFGKRDENGIGHATVLMDGLVDGEVQASKKNRAYAAGASRNYEFEAIAGARLGPSTCTTSIISRNEGRQASDPFTKEEN